jgi:peptidoglycan/LPS O-acetylase OafA/YrhL
VGFCILLLHSIVAPEWGFYRVLNWAWVRQIGIWSYSIYIWQQLFWGAPPIWGLGRVWWMGLWAIPLLAVTLISYYGLERPFFTLRSRHREVKLRE